MTRAAEQARNGRPGLGLPAAVRLLDLEMPLTDLRLPRARLGGSYRSLVAVARLDGDPLGAVTVPVGRASRISRRRLAYWLRRNLEDELSEAFAARGLPFSESFSLAGVPGLTGPGREPQVPSRSVSVVVTTCSRPAALERCLRSVLASDYPTFEVIVVENRPRTPGTEAMLTERFANEPRLRYVEENRPGLSRARNRGLSCAEGEVVAFTDDDVIVDPAWVRRSAEAFETSDDVACVTGLILPLELETDSQLLLEQFAGLGKGFRRHTYRLAKPRNKHPLAVQMPGAIGSGANTAVRAEVASELAGFDESLGAGTPAAGGEDLDLYIRLLREGYAIAYEPSAIVRHQHPDGTSRLNRQVYRYGVGLGALVTKQLVAGPERRRLLRAVPAGVRHARDPGSRKNAGKPDDYPRRLEWLERLGMLSGPVAYLLSVLVTATRHLGAPAKRPEPATSASDGGRRIASPVSTPLIATAAVACVVAPLVVLLGLPSVLRLPAVLALLCLAPGTALVTSLRGRAELGLVVGASLASGAVLAQTMLWLGVWWPTAYICLLAAACWVPLFKRLPSGLGAPIEAGNLRLLKRTRTRLARTPKFVWGHAALLSAVLAAWAASLASADLGRIDGIGLISAMPPTYFLAFAGLLIGFVLAVSRERVSRPLLGAYVVALILILHGTTPLLYDEPRYQWVYNHLAVIDLIEHTGGVDRHVDIYNNWPGFFALNAVFAHAGGVAPISYAPWAQVFFALANVAALRFALRGVTGSERLLWTATWLFLLGNWVAQEYLSPQAFGFLLSLVVLGLCLRCAPIPRPPRSRRTQWWAARLEWLRSVVVRRGTPGDEPPPPAPLSPRGALAIGGLCYLAIVISHQLTPLMLLAGVTGLAILGRRVPLWVPAAMAAVEVWWFLLAWPYVGQHWSLFDLNTGANAAPPGYEPGQGMSGLILVADGARALTVLMIGLAAIGLFRRARAGHWDLAVASLIVAPMIVVGAQSYGGEGPYRLYLFALPWLSLFAAAACLPSTRTRPASGKPARIRRSVWAPKLARQWRLALASGLAGVCLLFAYFGLEYIDHIRPQDVATAEWFERNGPPDSLLVQATSNSVSRVTYRYATTYATAHTTSPALTDEPAFRHRLLDSQTLPRLEAKLRSYGAPHTFLILTAGQKRFAQLYGILPPGWHRILEQALDGSPSFRQIYRQGDDLIYEYQP
jgi:GT2 family glycosyltransferase